MHLRRLGLMRDGSVQEQLLWFDCGKCARIPLSRGTHFCQIHCSTLTPHNLTRLVAAECVWELCPGAVLMPEFGLSQQPCTGSDRGPHACKLAANGRFSEGIVGNLDFAVLLNKGPVVFAVEVQDRPHAVASRVDKDLTKERACKEIEVHVCYITSPQTVLQVDALKIEQEIYDFLMERARNDMRLWRALCA